MFTLVAAGCVSALLFALAVYTPSRPELGDLVDSRTAMMATTNTTLQGLDAYAAAVVPPNAALAAEVAAQNKTFVGLGNPSTKWVSNSGIIKSMVNASALQSSTLKATLP